MTTNFKYLKYSSCFLQGILRHLMPILRVKIYIIPLSKIVLGIRSSMNKPRIFPKSLKWRGEILKCVN